MKKKLGMNSGNCVYFLDKVSDIMYLTLGHKNTKIMPQSFAPIFIVLAL